jgi:zinc transporter ZupT
MATMDPAASGKPEGMDLRTWLLLAFPVVLLALVIAVFLLTSGAGLNLRPAAPVEGLSFERLVLRPGEIEVHVLNTGPEALTLSSAILNESVWPFQVEPGETLARLGRATLTFRYPWIAAEPLAIKLFTANAIPFETAIDAAAETVSPGGDAWLRFTLVGLYVGVIPVLLGICWYPALRRMGRGAFVFLMALTVGLLLFLGIDAVNESLEVAAGLGGPFQGVGLVATGLLAAYLLLEGITRRQARLGRGEADQRLRLATMIAVGIGLHNLGEGLAIGAAYRVGEAALGTFLVIGFVLQNITEGLGILAPVVRDRPSVRRLVTLGLIGGVPAIAGTWIGGSIDSTPLAALFLAIGAGAVFEVMVEVARLIRRQTAGETMPLTVFSGVMAGMLLLYATGFLVK